MKEFNNIDELFNRNLSDFKIEPDENGWSKFEAAAFSRKKTYYREIMAIAALLLISGGIFIYLNYFSASEDAEIRIDQPEEVLTDTPIDNVQNTKYDDKEVVQNIISDDSDNNEPDKTAIEATLKDENMLVNETESEVFSQVLTDDMIPTFEAKAYPSFISLGRLVSKTESKISQLAKPSITNNRDIIDITEYLEKKRKFHAYTGISMSAGIMYYSDTPDQFTWSSDLIFGYNIHDFYIETGVGYQEVKQHGDYRIEYESNDSVGYYNQVTSFELNPADPNEIFYNTKTKTVYDSISHYVHQSPVYQYNYINIPLTIGYKFFKNDMFWVSGEVGIIYSYLSNTMEPHVSFSEPEAQLIDIINYTPERTRNNFRIHIGIRASYRIHRSVSLNIQPEFSSYLNSVYDKESNKTQRPYNVGFRAGLLFNF